MSFLIGQAPRSPCPVCSLSPVALRELVANPELAECARCGLTFLVRNENGDQLPEAVLSVAPSYLEIFRQYHQETGSKLGPPPFLIEDPALLDPELLARMRALDEWLKHHPELVAGAAAPTSWAFVSLTMVVTTVNGEPAFSMIPPPDGFGDQRPFVPLKPHGLPVGTVVTVQIPLRRGEMPPPPEFEIEGHA